MRPCHHSVVIYGLPQKLEIKLKLINTFIQITTGGGRVVEFDLENSNH